MSARPILVVSQLPPPVHGSSLMTRAFLSAMSDDGVPVILCDRRYSRTVDEIGRASLRKMVASVGLARRVCTAVVRARPAVAVVFVTNRPASFLSDVVLTGILRAGRVRVVHYVHTVGFTRLAQRSRWWSYLVRRVLSAGETVVGLGDALLPDVAPWIRPGSYRSIPNIALDPPKTLPDAHREEVVYFSNLIPEKGAVEFVCLAVNLAERLPDVTFVIAGAAGSAPYMAEFEERMRSARLGDRLSYRGPVVGDAKWPFLSGARVHVFPSTYPYEAQPLSVIESLYVGTPVVAFAVGGLADLAWCPHLTLVEPGDLVGLAAAVETSARSTRPSPRTVAEVRAQLGRERYRRQWADVLGRLGITR